VFKRTRPTEGARHDPERADGGQRPAVLAVQLVDVITNHDQLALVPARQVEIPHQALARVVVAVPFVVHTFAAVLPLVTVARVISRIEHGCPPDMALRWVVVKAPGRLPRGAIQEGAERLGRCAARRSGRGL
jgi:hypothetical protein